MDLQKVATDLMKNLLPTATPLGLAIDRIHRIAKPPHLAASVPRDVLMRVNFFQTKEALMAAARAKGNLDPPYDNIQLFPDLSKYTLQLRRQLGPITKALNNHKIQYKWRYPATLVISKNWTFHKIISLTEGMKLLYTWGIILDPPQKQDYPQQKYTHQQNRRTSWNQP